MSAHAASPIAYAATSASSWSIVHLFVLVGYFMQVVKLRTAYIFPFIAMFAIGMLLNVELFWSLKLAIAVFYYFVWYFISSWVSLIHLSVILYRHSLRQSVSVLILGTVKQKVMGFVNYGQVIYAYLIITWLQNIHFVEFNFVLSGLSVDFDAKMASKSNSTTKTGIWQNLNTEHWVYYTLAAG